MNRKYFISLLLKYTVGVGNPNIIYKVSDYI